MDKKKLIGTIVGVTMFAALIAGATFAWFTFTVNVTNGNYSGTTRQFAITYNKGTNIGGTQDDPGVPMLAAGTADAARSLVVSAEKVDDTMTGNFYIKLNTTSSTSLTTSGALNYAVCSGTSTAASCTSLAQGQTGVLATGTVTASGDKTIFTQPISYTTTVLNDLTYYWIFFWLDGNVITNDHLGQEYSGYIHASATQN